MKSTALTLALLSLLSVAAIAAPAETPASADVTAAATEEAPAAEAPSGRSTSTKELKNDSTVLLNCYGQGKCLAFPFFLLS